MRPVLLACAALALLPASASADPLTIGVIGDTPYGPFQISHFRDDIAQLNADRQLKLVIHVGDIKNGSSRCDSSYFEARRADFDLFADPLVYTPGDNEWTDCHRNNNGRYQPAGAPLLGQPSRLDEVRRIFFDRPGVTLGQDPREVVAQSPQFPENVRWTTERTVFGTLHVVGSQDDGQPWFTQPTPAGETPLTAEQLAALDTERVTELTARRKAARAWLGGIFNTAERQHAAAVVIGIQADMWDPENVDETAFGPLVAELAARSAAFGKPVLLLNGDSHVYKDTYDYTHPLAADSTLQGLYGATPAPNLTRITVQGSESVPREYLRLHIDPRTAGVFSWENVTYAFQP